MVNILFLNHKKKQCGVYQYGIRIYDIIKKTNDINYIYQELDSFEEYNNIISNINNTLLLSIVSLNISILSNK